MTERSLRVPYPQPDRHPYPAGRPSPGASAYPMPRPGRGGLPRPPRWNKLSIAAIVCSLVGFVAPLGVLLGVVATVQCTRSFQRGRGLAICAIVLGAAMTTLFVVANTVPLTVP